jgi:hypothetical protein
MAMDAKMYAYSAAAQPQAGAEVPAGMSATLTAAAHVDHIMAVLVQAQADAQALKARLGATHGRRNDAAVPADVASDVAAAMQQTLAQLRHAQAEMAEQQARLEALQGDARLHAGVAPHKEQQQDAKQAASRAHARRLQLLAEAAGEAQALRERRQEDNGGLSLKAGPAAGSGLGPEGQPGDDAPRLVQMPAGERESLDAIVGLIGGMLKSSATPLSAGRQPAMRNMSWQAQPESAPLAEVKQRWGAYVAGQRQPENMDINQLIQWVMREAYVGNTEDLRNHATRLDYYTSLKKQIRIELTRAREFRSQHRVGEGKEAKLDTPYDKQHIVLDPQVGLDGMYQVRPPTADGTTDNIEELDAYIKQLDNALTTVGDDAQMAQLDLQNLTQRQAQVVNMLSNLSKAMHETAMSIIRKVGS